jgi:hypothetical protein
LTFKGYEIIERQGKRASVSPKSAIRVWS